jgi:adenylate kinase family enzyme
MSVSHSSEPATATIPRWEVALLRFRLLASRRCEWLRRLWTEEGEPGGRVAVTHGEVDCILADRDSPEAEVEWFDAQPRAVEWNAELTRLEAAADGDRASRLGRLRQIFGLAGEECDLFEACFAVSVDPSLARLCAYLQDQVDRRYVTDGLAARLYRRQLCGLWTDESPLKQWELILAREAGVGEPLALECDPQVRDWVMGKDTLHEALAGIVDLVEPRTPPASWPLAETVDLIARRVHGEESGRVRVTVVGPRLSGRRTFAAAVSAELGLPLLAVDTDQIVEANWRRVHLLAQRHAFLQRTALAWHGESTGRRPWPRSVPPFPVQFALVESGQEPQPCAGVVEHVVRLPPLTSAERSALWSHYVPEARQWPREEFNALVERYRVHVGDIVDAAQRGVGSASDARERVREAGRGRFGKLAQWLDCPFRWDDLVVAPYVRAALEDIVYEAQHRVTFWERDDARRLFPQGRGLMTLFSGPPGTGKTMAAQVMAATLGFDLFRVDLSGVVSKWVGETSQNFEKILSRAADMHAMMLFDECDAIFAKRTTDIRDAQDKFANTDAAYLLQAVESFPGIALMATNQKGNIDPAFIRRLRYVLEFARPDAAQRLEIWRKVVGGLAEQEQAAALGRGLEALATAVDVTGSQIKFATLGALFGAQREGGPIELVHLIRGLDRELAKEGRALSERERVRILNHAR